MFDWEQGIVLHGRQGNRASSPGERELSLVFSSCGRNLGCILELQRGWTLETRVCSAKPSLLSNYDRHLRNLNKAWQDKIDASGGEVGDQVSLSSWHSDIGISINFQEDSGIGPFEALNSARLSRCQRDVRLPVLMMQRPRAFSRVSTGDSDIP